MRLNRLGARSVVEPFAGGAGLALSALYLEETPTIHINDADPAIHAFWWSVVHNHRQFLRLLDETPVNLDEWQHQRIIYQSRRASRLSRGFATFYLNRCNRSGVILDGGVIGGVAQKGRWKLDARFNKDALRPRIERIGEYRDRIEISGIDALELIRGLDAGSTFLFIDPPYFHKGDTLYLNSLDADYHEELATYLREGDVPWILTYDDCPEIRALYTGWATVRPYSLRYSAFERRQGREVLIAPPGMFLPDRQESKAIRW